MNKFLRTLFVLIIVISPCANANDSTARVGAGGLELLKTDNIQMVSEVLEISTSKIRVKYHFLNTSDKDVKTTVAFPMPAFDGESRSVGGAENQRPLNSFHIFVNGSAVTVNKNRVFLINNIDVTDKFKQIGLTDDQIFDPLFGCMSSDVEAYSAACNLSPEKISAIQKMQTGGPWQIKETAYWEQTFPAGKGIDVVHEYEPFSGSYPYSSGALTEFDHPSKASVEACLDDKTVRAITTKKDNAIKLGDVPSVGLHDVEYILGTGRNWKGPIKNFKLFIKKDSPDDIVSLCFPGKPKKTTPTTIEFSQSNFEPQDKLIVFFYHIGSY